MELGLFLRLAVGLASALRELHAQGIIHKDVKPANLLVDTATGGVWLMGFGIASRLRRERQAPEPPEMIAGSLAGCRCSSQPPRSPARVRGWRPSPSWSTCGSERRLRKRSF